MKYISQEPALLLLEDGTEFYGKAAGARGIASGEICFNTGMTGYQEIFTDPSYQGQLMVMASVHIGNYGILSDESESSSIHIAGLVCRNLSPTASRKSADQSIQDFLARQNLVVITDVDTRAIVRHIRNKGAMNALICTDGTELATLKKRLLQTPSMEGLELSSIVSTSEPYYWGDPESDFRIAVLDVGVKFNTLRCLAERGAYVRVYPWNSTFAEMQEWNPDGYLVSNGPGDPQTLPGVIQTVREILNAQIPLFGICMGHQLLAEACGIKTFKMHHGHRGINHPVLNLETGKGEISSQNHGFAVQIESLENSEKVTATHVNLNDHSVEGIRVNGLRAFSVQYHPEAAPGPHDSAYLFDDFMELVREGRLERSSAVNS